MSHPREILNRAQRQRALRRIPGAPQGPAPAPVAPAPAAPAPAAPAVPARADALPPSPPVPQPVPRPVGGHALYSEVMRSHDRMGTRHLKP